MVENVDMADYQRDSSLSRMLLQRSKNYSNYCANQENILKHKAKFTYKCDMCLKFGLGTNINSVIVCACF